MNMIANTIQVSPMGLAATLPPVIERHELKYVIPSALVEPITDFLMPYCAYDQHSAAHDDGFYPVNSLYFDTPNYRFLKQRMWGVERRFNMRVRAYADGSLAPYFAEVKYKTPTCVKKFRATLGIEEWPLFLHDEIVHDEADDIDLLRETPSSKEHISRELFLRLASAYAIEPKIFTCYRRRAFISHIDDYARVTFDIDMRYRAQDPLYSTDPYSLSPTDGCINYDGQNIYDNELHYQANVILELKATVGSIPIWMIELIRRFELKQVGFSKYMNSSLVEHLDNGLHYMDADRMYAYKA